MKPTLVAATLSFLAAACGAVAHENSSQIVVTGDQRCITSNGTPNHDIGTFPNAGNPHSFRAQTVQVCVDATPEKGETATHAPVSGISLTGIPFRPGTADWYDADSRRGFSRDPSSGWNLEGMGAADLLGMDAANAHVDNRGLYHYHAVPASYSDTVTSSLIGYAADGFEIHYLPDQAISSWQLKDGARPSEPYGPYDGTYVQDWQYVAGSGTLDECNGAKLNGKFVYFATDSYPYFPRCFWGDVSPDFLRP